MVSTHTFTNFGRRQAALKRNPHVVIAETPNPIRQLDEESIRQRAEAMLDTVIWGLTTPARAIQERNQEVTTQPRAD